MNYKILGLVALLTGPATAQETTLNFQGGDMTGTSTFLPTGLTAPANGGIPDLPTAPVIGTFTGSIVVDGSIAAHNLNLVDFGFTFTGNNGTPFSVDAEPGQFAFLSGGGVKFTSPTGEIDLTTSHGAITGASVFLSDSFSHGPSDTLSLGAGGGSFTWEFGSTGGNCDNLKPQFEGGVYTGSTINPCSLQVSGSSGAWLVTTTAPEIDPASAASGLTLLLGGIAVLRGRRKLES
jgi:hypothetical protein